MRPEPILDNDKDEPAIGIVWGGLGGSTPRAIRRNGDPIPPRRGPFPHPLNPRAIPALNPLEFPQVNIINRDNVLILPDRQRQDFDPEALQELKNSIEDGQLMHPPVLRAPSASDRAKFPEIAFDGKMVLVAGERRFRVIGEIYELGGQFRHNGQTFTADTNRIPYTDLGSLDELEAEEAELDENLKRRDLTWQELAAAHDRLHRLRVKQRDAENAEARIIEAPIKPSHTVADTAQELTGRRDGSYQDTVRKELIVAKHLDNPLVAKAKSVDEAFKVLKKQEETAKNVQLARTVGATFNADKHQLFNRNCLDYMAEVAAGPDTDKFDVILTDPPYGMGADQFGDGAGKVANSEHHYDDSYESFKALMDGPKGWCNLSYQVCKPQAHAYVFCDIDRFHELKSWMQQAGWYVFRTPLINHKMNSGRVPLPDRGPRRQYEIILYAIKGGKPVTHIYPDVISTSADENLTHGAQKPVALYQNLLQRSVKPGDRVFDAFAGSGTIFEAAHGYKCHAVGTELSPEYYGMSLARIKRLKQLETPDIFEGL